MAPMSPETLDRIREVTARDELQADNFAEIDCADEFNRTAEFPDGIPIKGYICRCGHELYGFLWLTEIGGIETEQWVFATPKLHYPVGKTGQFHWPSNVQRLLVYPKLDGTNVLAYTYEFRGKRRLTFKSRLTAVIQNNRFNMLQDLWRQCLAMYSDIQEALIGAAERQSFSFEMYGNLNTILVRYDVPIDCRLLFTVGRESPEIDPPVGPLALGSTEDRKARLSDDDLTEEYNEIREREEKHNDVGRQVFLSEGAVMYTGSLDAGWQMWKAKPPSIEHIHRGISDSAIYTTAANAFENWDDPTFENVRELLMEEYPGQHVDSKRTKIEKALVEIRDRLELRAKVIRIMTAERLIFTPESRGDVMRALSKHFSKQSMRRVYQAVAGC